ncbi:MAG: histidine kinase [Roseivirga sp.]|nr:histidine kinase [Roseivirga sp.]
MGISTIKNSTRKFFGSTFFKHSIFWAVVFVYFTKVSRKHDEGILQIAQITFFELLIQIAIAYTVIYILTPRYLNRDKKLVFAVYVLLMVLASHTLFSIYLNYFISNGPGYDAWAGFIERTAYTYGYVSTFVSYFSPAVVLLVFNYYKQQKEVANILEQKKTSELNALKSQLNPHFLFNTLNNLYTLALKKSDKTPDVIARLSDILDYILYRCDKNFVPLANEVGLLHNYIALEKVRYGKRVDVSLKEEVNENVNIAPLLLLTFLENAFKHGVAQEANTAKIDVVIRADTKLIDFEIVNSIPQIVEIKYHQNRDTIGLENVRKQLDLLYSGNYDLDITHADDHYRVHLKITPHDL